MADPQIQFVKNDSGGSYNALVAEPISTSTPQMIYKVKRVSNDSQNTMKETKAR